MKKKIGKIIVLWMVFTLIMPASFVTADEAETEYEESIVLVTVNGRELTEAEIDTIESQYLSLYEANGYDITDEDLLNEVHDLAIEQAIEDVLVDQDMEELGFYEYSDENLQAAQEAANLEYTYWCEYYTEIYYYYIPDGTDEDAESFSEELIEYSGYTEENLTNLYLNSYALEEYKASLTADIEISEEEIETAYQEYVERDKESYADDIGAFEEALYYSDDQVWYIPDGFRAFRQILLPAEGEDEESMIASVQGTIDEIEERKEDGEDIEALIDEYGNPSDNSGDYYREGGYWIHPDSVIWAESITEAAFGKDVQEIGDFAEPVAGNSNVYLLIYVGDVKSGAVELTEELKPVVDEEIRSDMEEEKYMERINELKEEADIVYEN